MTYTFAELDVPAEVYDLIAGKLIEAGYGHVFNVGVKPEAGKDCGPINMHGIALTRGSGSPGTRAPWEYKFFDRYGGTDGYNADHPLGRSGEDRIAEFGADGWELVCALPFGGAHVLVFKRPLKDRGR
jgi:hypothetical protein